MAYDRYDTRRDWRGERSRWRDDDRFDRASERGFADRGERFSDRDRSERFSDRDRDERGFFERAGDEIASWFGDEEADRRRRRDNPDRQRGSGWGDDRSSFSGHLRNQDDIRAYYSDRDSGRRDRAFMSDEDFSRFERSPRWRDEGYRRPYTGRFSGRNEPGRDRGDQPYRPMAGDYGRGSMDERVERGGSMDERVERGGSYYGVAGHPHDRHYGEWRARQIDELDRDYDDFARENQSRFENEFAGWRETRQQKRGLLGQVREHMEVVGSDGEPVGTVDCTRGDRFILTKSDPESGGAHHSLMCTSIDRIEGDKVILDSTAADAQKRWRDENRERALFERDDQGEAGPHILGRSFSGTY